MISDILTAIIIFLMAVLVLYPTTRVLLQSWHNWQRHHGGAGGAADAGAGGQDGQDGQGGEVVRRR